MILDDSAAIKAYTNFLAKYSTVTEPSETAEYPKFEGSKFDIGGMAFSMMSGEHVITIANTVNSFLMYLRQLKGWTLVVRELDEEAAWRVLINFVEPLAYFCLDAPYRIKQQICSSTAQLSHQANRVRVQGWTDTVKLSKPKFDDAQRQAGHWNDWPRLEACLGELNSDAFCEATEDFRNKFHHGFPRRVGTGYTSFVERTWSEEGVRYAFGSKPPLALVELVAALEPQYAAALSAFNSYVDLVLAQRLAVSIDG